MDSLDKNRNSDIFNSPAYRRSRIAYAAQCTFEYLISLLITDAFLAKFLTSIGISDSLIGIVSSFISFSFLFQLLSIWLVNRMRNIKKTVIFFDSLSQLLYVCMYCVPFLEVTKGIKTALSIGAIFLAYFFKYIVSSVLYNWANSYVAPCNRGSFSAIKEMLSLFFGMIFTLVVGFVVDKYEAAGNLNYGFVFIVILILVLNIFNIISMLTIKNQLVKKESNVLSTKDILQNTIGNKNFRNVIILISLHSIATYMTASFMGTFKTNDLLLSVGIIQVINAAGNLARLVCSVPLGKYSDKKSYARGIELALFIAGIAFTANIFTTNKTWWLVIIYTVLYSVSAAGTNANKLNITYSYVKSEYISQAMAIQNCISGILGFLTTLIGSFILSYIQKNGNVLFGVPVYGQQVLSAISLAIIICAIVYDRLIIEKQEIMIQ